MADVRIGISGWTYPPWRGTFFPRGLRQSEELSYASRQVSSIEINGTFYSLQRPSSYASWDERTPADFLFSVKAPRFVTHIRRLKEVQTPVANFFASGILRLGEKLGPVLWQLPPSLPYDADRLEKFLTLLPRTTAAAATLARLHDGNVPDPWLKADPDRPLRHALEVRHVSFQHPDFINQLRQHGDAQFYVSGYTDAALREWARKIRVWCRGGHPAGTRLVAPSVSGRSKARDIFVYFDNDVKTRAPYDAMTLTHLLGLGPPPPVAPPVASIAEEPRTLWPAYPSARKPRKSSAAPRTKAAAGSP